MLGALYRDRYHSFLLAEGTGLSFNTLYFPDIRERIFPAGKCGAVYRIIHLCLCLPGHECVVHGKNELAGRVIPLLLLFLCKFHLGRGCRIVGRTAGRKIENTGDNKKCCY